MNAKKLLMQAIEKLTVKMPFEKITVQDILNEAEISRGTFYKYYKDKYDLANDYYEHYVKNNVLTKFNGDNWEDVLVEILSFIKHNKDYFQSINKIIGANSFEKFLSNFTFEFLSGIYKRNLHKDELTELESYHVHYVTGAGVYVLFEWMKNEFDVSAESLANLFIQLMPEMLYKYID